MIRLALSLACTFALAGLVGCSDAPPQPVKPPTPEVPPAKTPTPTPVEPAPVKPAPPEPPKPTPAKPRTALLAEADVQALLDGWLKAQNEGAFAAYSSLYGTRFFGIKRSGERTYRFDRNGWLADRKRMFKRPMTVTAADVKIVPGPSTAVVRFTQTWASGDYRDVGPKQLVIARQGRDLRIAREEMLSSTLLDPTPRAADGVDVHHVIMGDAPYVVLGPAPEVTGEPTIIANEKGLRTVRVKAPRTADPRRGSWVALYASGSQTCTGTIDELAVIGRVWPHWFAEQTWRGEADDTGEKATEAEIARDVWEMSEGARVLVGRLSTDPAECRGAVFARFEAPGEKYAGQWMPVKMDSDNSVPHATGMLREQPKWKALQDLWVQEQGTGNWDAEYPPTVTSFSPPSGQPMFFLGFDAGIGCGEFGGALWSAWQWYEKGISMRGAPHHDRVRVLAAVDGPEGRPLLIAELGYSGERVVLRWKKDDWVPVRRLPTADLNCPC